MLGAPFFPLPASVVPGVSRQSSDEPGWQSVMLLLLLLSPGPACWRDVLLFLHGYLCFLLSRSARASCKVHRSILVSQVPARHGIVCNVLRRYESIVYE